MTVTVSRDAADRQLVTDSPLIQLLYVGQRYLLAVNNNTYHSIGHCVRFIVTNGVIQGGAQSPLMCRVYVRYLMNSVGKSKTGCRITVACVDVLAYGGRHSPTVSFLGCLQELLNVRRLHTERSR